MLNPGDRKARAPLTIIGALQRYLAARKGNVAAAVKMLRKTLEWRQSYRPQDITFREVSALAATGRLEVMEHRDLEGRPVLCYRLR